MIRSVFVAAAFAFVIMAAGNSASATRTGDVPAPATTAGSGVPGSFRVAQRCISTDAIIRKVMRRGFYNIHKVRPKTHTMKMRGYKRGMRYRIKVDRCSGNIIWTEPMPE